MSKKGGYLMFKKLLGITPEYEICSCTRTYEGCKKDSYGILYWYIWEEDCRTREICSQLKQGPCV